MTISEFKQKQSLPYEAKIAHAEKRAWEFYDTITGRGDNVHVSVGGLDSITLLVFCVVSALMRQQFLSAFWKIREIRKYINNWALCL